MPFVRALQDFEEYFESFAHPDTRDAETYYGAVRVWDGLENARICYTDGVLYDHTPPNVSLATPRAALLAADGAQDNGCRQELRARARL